MKKIIDWYKARSTWAKILLAIPIAIVITLVILSFIPALFKKRSNVDVVSMAVDEHEHQVDERLAELEAKDAEAAEQVKQSVKRVQELDKEGAEATTEREKKHAEIDRADTWADLDRINNTRDLRGKR